MNVNEDATGDADEAAAAARGTTQRNATGPASEQCEHGDSGRPLSNDGEEKLFRPAR